jgi:competence protein ComEC
MSEITRFRAYQLGNKGSSFSYSVDKHFTLIEARYNETNKPSILFEMKISGVKFINDLHITSWDDDHCKYEELSNICLELKPSVVQYPGYKPHTDNGKKCLQFIKNYEKNETYASSVDFTPERVKKLVTAQEGGYRNVIYNPIEIVANGNDNSLVQLFRTGRFTVLSLGDCEDKKIADRIMSCEIASNEVDVMIMAHHGADNGFTTTEFLKKINPKIAICSSNYNNQFDHPRDNIRNLLHQQNINLYTTKTGDVVVFCNEGNKVHVANLISNSEVVNSKKTFNAKLKVPD